MFQTSGQVAQSVEQRTENPGTAKNRMFRQNGELANSPFLFGFSASVQSALIVQVVQESPIFEEICLQGVYTRSLRPIKDFR
jgi:hypothetical protein